MLFNKNINFSVSLYKHNIYSETQFEIDGSFFKNSKKRDPKFFANKDLNLDLKKIKLDIFEHLAEIKFN